ncbi:MAG TPA: MATE family efflux transporter, partial [Devosia sp.]|nr:MATE family efflux transporter [Devosia sp.]
MFAPKLVARGWSEELLATFRLGWPLVVAQLAGMALNATDVIMMGWLGPNELAAGSLATSMLFP